jgi:hypothetical protein
MTGKVEYLYRPGSRDSEPCVERLRIVKRTPKRVYYVDVGDEVDERGAVLPARPDHGVGVTRFVDRVLLEANGLLEPIGWRNRYPWTRPLSVYLTAATCFARAHAIAANNKAWRAETAERDAIAKARLAKLKVEMIAAHPDRGGSNEKFISAHARYRAAQERKRY